MHVHHSTQKMGSAYIPTNRRLILRLFDNCYIPEVAGYSKRYQTAALDMHAISKADAKMDSSSTSVWCCRSLSSLARFPVPSLLPSSPRQPG
jgi:hypothetical protein